MQRFSREPIDHLDTERGGRREVVGFFGEETDRLLDESVKALLCRKVGLVTRYGCPEQRRTVHRVVARGTLHRRELAARVVLDAFQFLAVVRPCHHVEVGADGREAEAVRFVQVLVDPLLVYLVGAGVTRERLHVAGVLLETLQVLLAVVDQHVLVVQVVAGEQQPHRRGEREAAVRAVGRELLVTAVGRHSRRQVFRVGKRVQAQDVVADAHFPRREGDVLQAGRIFQ